MKRVFRFYKSEESRWYVDLPEWTKSTADLEMVEGADKMLDTIANDKNECFLQMSDEPFTGADEMKLINDRTQCIGGGADYLLQTYKGKSYHQKLWLCAVTETVFGTLPDVIYVDYPAGIS